MATVDRGLLNPDSAVKPTGPRGVSEDYVQSVQAVQNVWPLELLEQLEPVNFRKAQTH
jgi:hypothetical protein